jgi:PAS domain S-box-containing protein
MNSHEAICFLTEGGALMKEKPLSQDQFHFLRQKAESYLLGQETKQGKSNHLDLLEILHEIQVHQVELEMQNEELRNTKLALETSRDDYFNLYELAPVTFLTVNAKGVIVKANMSATALLNVERHFLINNSFLEFVIPEDRGRFYQLQKKVSASNRLEHCEMTLQVKNKKRIPIRLEMLALHHEEKGEIHFLVVAIDISQHKQVARNLEEVIRERTRDLAEMNALLLKEVENHKHTERILRDEEKKFRTVADFTCNWEFWIGPDKRWLYNSPACEKICGYARGEFMVNPGLLLSIIHPEDRKRVQACLDTHFCEEREESLEFRLIAKDGQVRWIEHCCQPVYDEIGLFLGRRASNRDITQRKHVEEQLQESETRFRLALDAASDGLWDRNLMTDQVHYGANWYKLLGYTEEDAQQGTITWESLLHPEDAEKAKSAVQDYIGGRIRNLRQEFRLRNKKGEWQWVLSKGKIVEWDENGRPIRVIGTHTDITARKTMELELKQQQEKLEEKVRQRTAELEETNTTLNVLLRKRDADKETLEAKITENISDLIDPYFEKLKGSPMTPWQKDLIYILQESIHQLTSPFMRNMGGKLLHLSPMEVQVANLVKGGKSSKEIAEILKISCGTVNIHRKNIRKKIGVDNQKTNLQVTLQSFMKE